MKRILFGALIGATLYLAVRAGLMGQPLITTFLAAAHGGLLSFVITMAIREQRLHKEAT